MLKRKRLNKDRETKLGVLWWSNLDTVCVYWLVPGSVVYCTCCPPDVDLLSAAVVYLGFLDVCSRGCQSTNKPPEAAKE